MLNRRNFLKILLASAIAPSLSACGNSNALTVKALKGSIPPQLLGEFKNQFELGRNVNINPITQLKELYSLLEDLAATEGQKGANLVTLGDIWLKDAIANELIQPLGIDSLHNWEQLPSSWQNLVQRDSQGNLDPAGKIWGAPYRWGSTVIAYREDKFGEAGYEVPTDWGDLWREELRDRVSLLDQPREIIGLTLKKLGESYNTKNLENIPNLKQELASLHQQVKFYSSQAYLQPLILEETWIAVGWSSDVLQLQTRYPDIKAIIPQSGTALWSDIWVQPTVNDAISEPLWQWIDFCWELQAAKQIGLFTNASSPILLNAKIDKIPTTLQQDFLRMPSPELLDKSEFLLPLSEKTDQQYQQVWKEMRTNQL
ncbi:MAG: polyamine ABC transporter substrate-binding protein [Cyanobacteria bacterium SW_9_44_58]|nr:MAG: polyamine ABC transporter substrate-binding protein [Cyanobacteria bacterium SW_9_44_58]